MKIIATKMLCAAANNLEERGAFATMSPFQGSVDEQKVLQCVGIRYPTNWVVLLVAGAAGCAVWGTRETGT